MVRPHNLRHTAATLLLKQGVPLKVVSEMLGHSRIEITANIYSHVGGELQAAAAQKLERLLE